MPNWKMSVQGLDKDRTAIASGRELPVSIKNTREVCNTIKGMTLERAKTYLEQVILMKRPVPFKRNHKKIGHRHGMKEFKYHAGRFPQKSARFVYEVLMNAESNAEYKGLDPDRLRVTHTAVMKGRKIKRYIERAHGRSTPYFKTLSHVEIVLTEF